MLFLVSSRDRLIIKPFKKRMIFVAAVFILLLVLYRLFDPYEVGFFPPCPFRELTGLKCPGCGSQRALHYLLHFELGKAFKENSLMILSIPYLTLGFVIDALQFHSSNLLKLRKVFYGETAIYIVIAVIVSYWIGRNVFI